MAGEMTGIDSKESKGIIGLGFAAGIYIAYDAMSTLNSSPWTHETFGSDPSKAASAQQYVRLAIISSTALSGLTSWLMRSYSPLAGTTVANVQLFYVYWNAKRKAEERTTGSSRSFAWTRTAKAA